MQVDQIPLPGIGTQYAFRTAGNRRIGAVRRRDGGRELIIFDTEDPDRALAVPLTGQEATMLAMLLGMIEVVEPAVPGNPGFPGTAPAGAGPVPAPRVST